MFDLWKGKTSWLVVLLITFITPIGFAGLFGDDIIFIKKTGVSGLDTNAETACGDNEYLRGDGTCQIVATEGITDTNWQTSWNILDTNLRNQNISMDSNIAIIIQDKNGNKYLFRSADTNIARGTTLLQAIATATDGSIIYLAPNIFDVGNNPIRLHTLTSEIDLSLYGSGINQTIIKSEYSSGIALSLGMKNSTIKDLSIISTANTNIVGLATFAVSEPKNVSNLIIENVNINGISTSSCIYFANYSSQRYDTNVLIKNVICNGGTGLEITGSTGNIKIYDTQINASEVGIQNDEETIDIYNTEINVNANNGAGIYQTTTNGIINFYNGVLKVSGLNTQALFNDGGTINVTANSIYDVNNIYGTINYIDSNNVLKSLQSLKEINLLDNNIIGVNYLKKDSSSIDFDDTSITLTSDNFVINSAIIYNGVYQSNLIPDSGDYNLGSVSNNWHNGYFDNNVYGLKFVGNLDGNVKAFDVNANRLNVIAPSGVGATTPLVHVENDTGGNIYDLFKLDVNKNGFRLYHGTRPTHMAGMDVTSDPKNMASSAAYIHGTSSGRIYFDCLTTAGEIGACYSMEFTNIKNFVDLPSRMLQNTSTTDTSMCSTGVACSSIGGTGTVDLVHVYQAVGYMSARGNQTTGQPAVKWRSFASDLSSYNSQAYYSTYSYDTNATAPYLTTLSHSKWLTAGVTKMTLTPDGNLSTAADINTATRFIARNQIGIDKNMTVTQGAGTCDLNFIGGILIASTC